MLIAAPTSFADAADFVRRFHRHLPPSVSHKFSIAATDETGLVRGVVVVGRPIARHLDDGLTVEIYRLATDGVRNSCSFLYGRACRAAFALGYRKVVTYTTEGEPGTSLVAAGWRTVARVVSRSWDCELRPRFPRYETQARFRWEKTADAR